MPLNIIGRKEAIPTVELKPFPAVFLLVTSVTAFTRCIIPLITFTFVSKLESSALPSVFSIVFDKSTVDVVFFVLYFVIFDEEIVYLSAIRGPLNMMLSTDGLDCIPFITSFSINFDKSIVL